MTIVVHVVSHIFGNSAAVHVPAEHMPAFKELLQRGANLWPDAPPEIKAFVDTFIEGKPMQNYQQLEYYKKARPRFRHYHRCSCGYVNIVNSYDSTPPQYSITCNNEEIPIPMKNPDTGEAYVKYVPCKRTEPFNKFPVTQTQER